jgi:hypothetical protein
LNPKMKQFLQQQHQGSLLIFFIFNANGLKANSYLLKTKQTKFIFQVIYL